MLMVADARHFSVSQKFKLVYADPPTNRGYGQRIPNYFLFTLEWLQSSIQLMQPDSWLVVCMYHDLRPVFDQVFNKYFSDLKFIQEIIWHYEFGVYTRHKFVPSHDNIFIFQRGTPQFHDNQINIPSQRLLSGDSRANPAGRVPGSVWSIPRVPGNDLYRRYIKQAIRTCSSQPIELCERVLKAYTKVGESVYDPFCGSGTMGHACKVYRRKYLGIDIEEEYVKQARERIKNGIDYTNR